MRHHHKRKRLLIDVDEVLADFHPAIFQIVESQFGRKLTLKDMETWDIFEHLTQDELAVVFQELSKPGFCSSLQPALGAIEAVEELRRHVEVTPVTRPFPLSPTWVYDRVQWLNQFFGFHESEVVSTASKHLIMGDALLDDRPQNVEEWQLANPQGLAMLWHTHNTRKETQFDHYRVWGWSTVIDRVQKL